MKKNYLLFLLLAATKIAIAQLPGSGNSLLFDIVDDKVTVPHHASLVMTNAVTVEAWINVAGYMDAGIIGAKTINTSIGAAGYVLYASTNDGNVYNLWFRAANATSNRVAFVNGFSIPSNPLRENNWVHVAGTFDGSIARLYVNGILSGSTPPAATPFAISDANYNFTIGDLNAATSTSFKFNGQIDELRIWNTVRTAADIQADMCRKISPATPNLQAYYRFDETTGTTLPDLTANANNGTLSGGPVWQTSGAAIGDASASSYTGATSSASLNNPLRPDAFTATLNTGSASGIHVFCVNQSPNTINGTAGVGGNNGYFGVFVSNRMAVIPTYTAVYAYTGIQGTTNPNDLRLYKRNNNAATTWADAVAIVNAANKTLTCTGQNTEYIVGSVGVILPLKLLSFTGAVLNSHHQLQWTTDNENNTRFFNVEKSNDARSFTTIGSVNAIGIGKNSYRYLDAASSGRSYYRLKIIDNDGRFSYSPIIKLSTDNYPISIYPNPAAQYVTISGTVQGAALQITDMLGRVLLQKKVSANTQTLDISRLAKGSYMVRYNDGKVAVVEKVVVE